MTDTERLEWFAQTSAQAEKYSNGAARDYIKAVAAHFSGVIRNSDRKPLDVMREALDAAISRD